MTTTLQRNEGASRDRAPNGPRQPTVRQTIPAALLTDLLQSLAGSEERIPRVKDPAAEVQLRHRLQEALRQLDEAARELRQTLIDGRYVLGPEPVDLPGAIVLRRGPDGWQVTET